MRYCLLGQYPGNSSYSILKYFNFYREHLATVLGATPAAACPGHRLPAMDEVITHAGRMKAWRENYLEWPLELRRMRSDLFHIVDQGIFWYARFLPDSSGRRGKLLGTVHDLIAYLISTGKLAIGKPSTRTNLLVRESMRQLTRLDHVISVSQFTADCMMRELGTLASRITVIPNHVDERFFPLTDEERSRMRRKWFGDARHVVIHVGRPLLYKNRLGAIKAFLLLRRRLPDARMFLVNGACAADERQVIDESPLPEAVRFIPSVSVSDLREIYGAADTLIFPSFYEGFGWPPVEAMACGCPVISSTRASLREVVGDAALTVEDPEDYEKLADLLGDVLTSHSTASDLRRRGLARAKFFSAAKALNEVAGVYRMLA